MFIEQIQIENFRLLKECTLDMRQTTTLLVGKNNTGKTSFVVLLEKFLERSDSFNYSDFPLGVRQKLLTVTDKTDIHDLTIRMILKIQYSEEDNIEILSEFMLDLDPARRHVNILLECKVNQQKLLLDQPKDTEERKKFIENNLHGKYLDVDIYAFDNDGYKGKLPYYITHRNQLEIKKREDLDKLLNFQVIHARRNVASSEEGNRSTKPLATISTKFFKEQSDALKDHSVADLTANSIKSDNLERISTLLTETDRALDDRYSEVFDGFLKKARDFLEIDELKVVSNIQSQSLIESSSKVIYGNTDNFLPENYSGLGYLNILYLLLQIEMCKENFSLKATPLNLLIIEEPEAHTHPQMQYVFADKVRGLIKEIPNLQAILTTHSSHIVAKSQFEDIRYLYKSDANATVTIKNFHTDLKHEYSLLDDGASLFKFLKQYLTINSSELFFASKAIFVEGTTEKMLLPWFIQQHDAEKPVVLLARELSSQNITVLEVGANAKAFSPFLKFIGIRTLVLTDIDTTFPSISKDKKRTTYKAHPVEGSTHTSNESIKFFFQAPSYKETDEFCQWHKNLLDNKLPPTDDNFNIAYQTKEAGYHARSFEDAFVALNLAEMTRCKDKLHGLKKKHQINTKGKIDIYQLTQEIIDKKSDFAASILFSALTKEANWKIPNY